MDDKRIVELYFERSENAVAQTAMKYGGYCYSIAYNILYSNEDAEESVNDTYISAWNSIPPNRPTVLSSFLGKLTRRISIDKWRKQSAVKRGGGEMPVVLDELSECIAGGKSVEQELDSQQLSDVINSFVKALPDTEQRVFLCRYWYLDSVEHICKRFGFSESKVKSMLHRTRKKLYETLNLEGF